MIINFDKKYIFVHIPRTAGTNLYDVLRGETYEYPNPDSKIFKQGAPGHLFARKLIAVLEDSGYDIKDFTIFSIVRNPYDRLHSDFWMRLSHVNPETLDALSLANDASWNRSKPKFETWLLNQIEPPPHARWDINDNWKKQPQKTCMLDWLTDRDGNIIVDYILRYENLKEELKRMSKIIDEPNLVNISREGRNNSIERPSYKQAYTKEMVNFVKIFHKKDLNYFKYSWG